MSRSTHIVSDQMSWRGLNGRIQSTILVVQDHGDERRRKPLNGWRQESDQTNDEIKTFKLKDELKRT